MTPFDLFSLSLRVSAGAGGPAPGATPLGGCGALGVWATAEPAISATPPISDQSRVFIAAMRSKRIDGLRVPDRHRRPEGCASRPARFGGSTTDPVRMTLKWLARRRLHLDVGLDLERGSGHTSPF
jgi:hypothetical protein